jgi:hypothetical protein
MTGCEDDRSRRPDYIGTRVSSIVVPSAHFWAMPGDARWLCQRVVSGVIERHPFVQVFVEDVGLVLSG